MSPFRVPFIDERLQFPRASSTETKRRFELRWPVNAASATADDPSCREIWLLTIAVHTLSVQWKVRAPESN